MTVGTILSTKAARFACQDQSDFQVVDLAETADSFRGPRTLLTLLMTGRSMLYIDAVYAECFLKDKYYSIKGQDQFLPALRILVGL